jgi:PKD repeat protein
LNISKYNISIATATLLFIIGCDKFEDPRAGFEVVAKDEILREDIIVDLTDSIRFINRSRYAITFDWNFGDGNSTTIKHPIHSFKNRGDYEVELRAYNADSEGSSIIKNVSVKERAITDLIFYYSENQLPQRIIIAFGETGGSGKSYSVVFPMNTFKGTLPRLVPLNENGDIFLTDKEWYWILLEDNAPFGTFGSNDSYIHGANFNPSRVPRFKDGDISFFVWEEGKDANGVVNFNYVFLILFELK